MTSLSRPTFAGKDPEAEQHTRQFLETLRHGQIQHGSELLEDGAVTTAKLAADAITEPKIADDAITAAQILAGAVGTPELADGGVTLAKLASLGSSNYVATDQSRTNTLYGDLTTVGPTVTLTTRTQVLVFLSVGVYNDAANTACFASVDISGATTVSAATNETNGHYIYGKSVAASYAYIVTRPMLITVNAGSNVFRVKYRTETSANAAHFFARSLIVMPG